MEAELFPPIFQRERTLRVLSDDVDRKVISIHRPMGIKCQVNGYDTTLWTASFIARYIRAFDEIYIIPSNASGKPLVMSTWRLDYLGSEIRDTVMEIFGLAGQLQYVSP